jgi:hypothetical protein
MGWKAGLRFPAEARECSLFHSAQTGTGAHSTSYLMGTGGSSPEDKTECEFNHLHVVSTSRMVELHLQFLIRLHSVVINEAHVVLGNSTDVSEKHFIPIFRVE